MDHIERNDWEAFSDYLEQTDNTICGRHAISILTLSVAGMTTKFVAYAQSDKCHSTKDSSVSYAAAVIYT